MARGGAPATYQRSVAKQHGSKHGSGISIGGSQQRRQRNRSSWREKKITSMA